LQPGLLTAAVEDGLLRSVSGLSCDLSFAHAQVLTDDENHFEHVYSLPRWLSRMVSGTSPAVRWLYDIPITIWLFDALLCSLQPMLTARPNTWAYLFLFSLTDTPPARPSRCRSAVRRPPGSARER